MGRGDRKLNRGAWDVDRTGDGATPRPSESCWSERQFLRGETAGGGRFQCQKLDLCV